jgi:hypothetical protein
MPIKNSNSATLMAKSFSNLNFARQPRQLKVALGGRRFRPPP